MKSSDLPRSLLLFASIAIPSAALTARAADGPKPARPPIYDTTADGKEQIAAALKTAQAENKRVILKFGANWCGWCHKLSGLLKTNTELAQLVKDNYVLVLIDVDKQHNADTVKKYDEPTKHGLPVLVVLDPDGTPIYTQDTGQFEEGDHHDPAKVKAFLEKCRKSKPAKA